MKLPSVTTRRFQDLGPPPPPFRGSGKSRRPVDPDYVPPVKLATGHLPSDENSTLRELVAVGIREPEAAAKSRRKDWIAGTVLGALAMLSVLNFWAAVTIGVLNDALNLSLPFWTGASFPLALYGCHLFGIPGAGLARGGFQLGIVAIVSFWGSLLLGIPISALISLLAS